MKITTHSTLISSLLFSLTTPAAVNMKEASFQKTFVDWKYLSRTYNSRSLHDGIFGFGWCSPFEKKLVIASAQRVSLQDCSEPTEVVYKNSVSNTGELLKFTGTKYVISRRSSRMTFNARGELILLQEDNGSSHELTYDQSGFLRKVVTNKKSILRFNYDYARRKVKEVLASGNGRIDYSYEGQNLQKTLTNQREKFTFSYDDTHNLLSIRYPGGGFETMTYDKIRDQILSVRDRQGCVDNYQYRAGGGAMISVLEKTCGGLKVQRKEFQFFDSTRADGTVYLQKLKISDGRALKEITYDAYSGATKKITESVLTPLRVAASQEHYE